MRNIDRRLLVCRSKLATETSTGKAIEVTRCERFRNHRSTPEKRKKKKAAELPAYRGREIKALTV